MDSVSKPQYLNSLNDKQLEAVVHGKLPLLILAGAGSGKTRVVTTRIAYLIEHLSFQGDQILAVTFTNKAAREMQERVLKLLDRGESDHGAVPMVKTFHSFCAWLLRRNAALVGLDPYFNIYDDDDSLALVKTVLPSRLTAQEAKMFHHAISRAKDDNLLPEDDLEPINSHPDFPEVYRLYEEKLTESGNVDFGGLIQKCVRMLASNPSVRSRLQQKFQVILVDEYQDSNGAQFELLKLLYGNDTWLAVVGDDDQSIYRFRGADVQHILNFPKLFADTKVIRLEQNYRSTGNILNVASQVVQNNQGRLGKTLWTENPDGKKPVLAFLEDQDQEAVWAAELIRNQPMETAILYRTNAQSRAFESFFVRSKIPYRIVGTLRFYEREEIKDILAWLSFLNNARDEIAFQRIVNKPARGLGKSGIDTVTQFKVSTNHWIDACGLALSALKGKAAKGLDAFLTLYGEFSSLLKSTEHLASFVNEVIERSGLADYHSSQDEIQNTSRRQNLDELVNACAPFPGGKEGLSQFLENIELDSEGTKDDGSQVLVTLITMHNTKGLEFDRVLVTGLEDGLFPRDESSHDQEEMEEERRLFYVAVTRARQELYLSTCRRRLLHGRFQDRLPSRFLREIHPEDLEQWGSGSLASDPWTVGQRVFHDDYGVGTLVKKWYNSGELVVDVRFDTGRMGRFLPAFTPLERIANDD